MSTTVHLDGDKLALRCSSCGLVIDHFPLDGEVDVDDLVEASDYHAAMACPAATAQSLRHDAMPERAR